MQKMGPGLDELVCVATHGAGCTMVSVTAEHAQTPPTLVGCHVPFVSLLYSCHLSLHATGSCLTMLSAPLRSAPEILD